MLWSAGALGQANPAKRGFGLDEDELAQMGAAAAKLYTDPTTAPGTSEKWQAVSGSSGTVRLVETYEFEGMPCARLLHRIQRADAADPQNLTIDRCQTPAGEWRFGERQSCAQDLPELRITQRTRYCTGLPAPAGGQEAKQAPGFSRQLPARVCAL